ncbi:3-oxo-5-alpha-steroid 4-dehydrogenase-domain-containing protein [Phlebopus sp. FC_14]|nr:3-oxo-5-alpha-steroid 4-dehydrogenase-domain-containing protein [Phlebopus sp. FC_14]
MHPLYDAVRWWSFIIPPIVCPFEFIINAPFGRFAPSSAGIFVVDGIKSWIVMELVSPISFLYALTRSPLASSLADVGPLTGPQLFLAGLFLVHYANRALVSPLRTPSRSKSHIVVPLSGACFNLVNGTLMGTYIGSSDAAAFLTGAFGRLSFWTGITLWLVGFCGNILHDEVLLNIRRNAKAKGKAKAAGDPSKNQKEHYAIPHGYLYKYLSYPNYFCEWSEWFGFALAASPLPPMTSLSAIAHTIQPPWLFFLAEVFLMIPRAYRGHRWYHETFPDYPKERKAVIPFIF